MYGRARFFVFASMMAVLAVAACTSPQKDGGRASSTGKTSDASAPGGHIVRPETVPQGTNSVKVPRLASLPDKVLEKAKGRRIPPYFGRCVGRRCLHPGPQHSNAPYFYVPGLEAKGVDPFPLKSTKAEVTIEGVVARVRMVQVYENKGKKPIEAVYVFPMSTRAAVRSMRMRIGSRTIVARVQEREKARKEYEKAVKEGRRASLLEQKRPNVFTMEVGNIMPGDRVEVSLEYIELLLPADGTYEFVLPTVVGPRYGGGTGPKDRWISNPYLGEGQKEPYKFSLDVRIVSPVPIAAMKSPSHEIDVKYEGRGRAHVTLRKPGGGNRDFVLRYSLAKDDIVTGAFVQQSPDGGYLMVLLEPPPRPAEESIPPREYVFILDTSGSMHGFPLDVAKKVIVNLLLSLRPRDMFNVILFASGFSVMSPEGSLPATPENVARAVQLVEGQRGGGGTELMQALEAAYRLPRREGISRTMVLVTDGYVGVEAQAFALVRRNVGKANVFAFGIGTSVNRYLVEKIARAGGGEAFVALNAAEGEKVAHRFEKYIKSPVLSDISVRFEGLKAYDVVPQRIPDLFASRPLLIMARYEGRASGTVHVTGRGGRGRRELVADLSKALRLRDDTVATLWAREWLRRLSDLEDLAPDDKGLRDAIVKVALAHHLVSRHTSFVAIDTEKANGKAAPVRVKQPLPLPEGVGPLAVGGSGPFVRRKAKGGVAMELAKSAPPLPIPSAPARSEAPKPKDKALSLHVNVTVKGPAQPAGAIKEVVARKVNAMVSLLKVLGIGKGIHATVVLHGGAYTLKLDTTSPQIRRIFDSIARAALEKYRKAGTEAKVEIFIAVTP